VELKIEQKADTTPRHLTDHGPIHQGYGSNSYPLSCRRDRLYICCMKIISVCFTLLFSCFVWANPCHQRHGALDIGSGSTKAFAAIVDTCEKRILETLFDEKIAVPFKEAVEASGTKEIPAPFIKEASAKISALIGRMKDKKLDRISAVATSVFRTAQNGSTAAQEISESLKIPVQILSQEEEAEIGAKSALSQITLSSKETRPLIVWDIGGGSMQMWAKGPEQPSIFKGDLASVNFKSQIIREIQKKDPQVVTSPNPIGPEYSKAIELATSHAKTHVPDFFKNAKSARWLGIGGVLALSVQNQIKNGGRNFSQSELSQALKKRSGLKDSEISSDYRSTEISNMALVLGYMNALNIQKIETFDTSLAQGWIYHQLSK